MEPFQEAKVGERKAKQETEAEVTRKKSIVSQIEFTTSAALSTVKHLI